MGRHSGSTWGSAQLRPTPRHLLRSQGSWHSSSPRSRQPGNSGNSGTTLAPSPCPKHRLSSKCLPVTKNPQIQGPSQAHKDGRKNVQQGEGLVQETGSPARVAFRRATAPHLGCPTWETEAPQGRVPVPQVNLQFKEPGFQQAKLPDVTIRLLPWPQLRLHLG